MLIGIDSAALEQNVGRGKSLSAIPQGSSNMLRVSALTFALVTAVTSGAIVGTTAMGTTSTDSTSCTCSTIDLESGSVTLAVLVDGTEAATASVSQQITQSNGDARVRIDVDYGETNVEIAGRTAENGSLILNVTQNGEVVNESIVVDGDETDTVVFRLESDDVRVTTDEEIPDECLCGETGVDVASEVDEASDVIGEICDVDPGVQVNADEESEVNADNVHEDTNVNTGNVSVNIPVLNPNTGDGDQSAESSQIIEDSGEEYSSQSNVAGSDGDVNATGSNECAKRPPDGDSSIPSPASGRLSPDSGTGANEFRVVIRSTDFTGLSRAGGDRSVSIGGLFSELSDEPETGSN